MTIYLNSFLIGVVIACLVMIYAFISDERRQKEADRKAGKKRS